VAVAEAGRTPGIATPVRFKLVACRQALTVRSAKKSEKPMIKRKKTPAHRAKGVLSVRVR